MVMDKEEKLKNHIDSQIELLKLIKIESEKPKNELKSFTNNQSRFQYDYEEDAYEPEYNTLYEEDEYDNYDQDEDGDKYPRIPK